MEPKKAAVFFARRATWTTVRIGAAQTMLMAALLASSASAEDGQSEAPPPSVPITVPAHEREPAEYVTAIDAAVLEHDAGHFTEARAQFLRAHAIGFTAVLATNGAARSLCGLTARVMLRSTTLGELEQVGLCARGPTIATLAR